MRILKSTQRYVRDVALALTLLSAPLVANANIILAFNLDKSSYSVGDTFNIQLLANTDITAAGQAFASWGLDLLFNNSVVSLDSLVLGSSFNPVSLDGDGLGGMVNGVGFPPATVSGSNILLATMTLTALSAGNANFMTGSTFGDGTEGFYSGFFQSISFINASSNLVINDVTPSAPVPTPATLGLFAIALFGLVGLRRKA